MFLYFRTLLSNTNWTVVQSVILYDPISAFEHQKIFMIDLNNLTWYKSWILWFFFFIIILFSMISKPMESVLLIHPWLLFPANSVINPEQNVKFRFRLITEFGFWNDIWKVKEKTFEKQPSPLTPTPNWTCRPIAKDPGSQKIKKWTMHFSPAYGLIIQ